MQVISRSEAKEQGLKRYFTGKPCPKDHIVERFVLDFGCVECSRIKGAEYRKNNPQVIKALTIKNASKSAEYQRSNKDKVNESSRKYAKNNRDKCAARLAKYRASKLKRTPAWTDISKIRDIYKLSAKLTKQTKIPHEVDHIIPLQGESVSGLHVPENLQIIPRFKNRSKSNIFNIEEYNAKISI